MKKYHGSLGIFYLVLVFTLLGFSIFITLFYISNIRDSIYYIIACILMLVVLPLILLLIMYKLCFTTIVINEKGIIKSRFNKTILFISWEELVDIKLYNPINPWIVFSKKKLDGVGIETARFFMKTISLVYVDDIGDDILRYCTNEKLLHELNIKKS